VSRPSWLEAVLAALTILLAAPKAGAWVERTVRSDSVTVDLDRNGTAVVTHEILLGVRGGPLPEIAVEGVDSDAEMLEGATATKAESGRAAGLPLPLSVTRVESRVVLHAVGWKGMRSGTHQIRFSYRTNLEAAGRLQPGRSSTTVEWTGPTFADGIDSARVVFRVPRGQAPPRLVSAHAGADAVSITDDTDGVFLGTFRRGIDKDELEVVRPHMAKGEAVPWRILVDASTFDVQRAAKTEETTALDSAVPARPAMVKEERDRRPLWAITAAVALLLSIAVGLKSRWVEAACRLRGATARPLLPLNAPLRVLLASIGVVGAVYAVVDSTEPLLAAGALLVSMAAATHLPPRLSAALRGPGKWVTLSPDIAFDAGPRVKAPGRFVDAGTAPGFALFIALLALFVAGAIVVVRQSSYEGVCVALGSAILFPLFCTGRGGELPASPAAAPRELLEWLLDELDENAFELSLLGRMPHGATVHDELRLLVTPKPALSGFVALEVGLDFHQGLLGLLPLPFVIVRAVENSKAADALPKGLLWTRGRNADERVVVLRPKLPTRRVTLELLSDVAERLSAGASPKVPQRPKPSAERSAGSGQSTAKAGTASSPLHAT
jgi:hypothetical protein